MSVGPIIGRAWELYKARWRHLLPIALVVYVVVALLTLVLTLLLGRVTAPFAALAWTLTYYELRALKEPEPAPAAAA